MNIDDLIISKGALEKGQLEGYVVLITGAGGGIGYEAARSLLWLGAQVIIAEVDKEKGKTAQAKLTDEFGEGRALFIYTDVGKEKSVKKLVKKAYSVFGKIDILINNATIAPTGAVHQVGIEKWDSSYKVNLRGPVLLISEVLPEMIRRNSGIVVLVPSSGAAPYLGAYEVFKTAQVELANTLSAELEKTEVITYSIGPGIVMTETAQKAIEKIAPLYEKSVEEFYKMSENALLTVEEAGAGFAASVVNASRYQGMEIGSIQALMDAKIPIGQEGDSTIINLTEEARDKLLDTFKKIRQTFVEQVEGWSSRPLFERQWVVRDFKKHVGAAPEHVLETLRNFEEVMSTGEATRDSVKQLPIDKIYTYYEHQIDLLKGYEKDPDKVKEYSQVMKGWLEVIDQFRADMNKQINNQVSN